MHVEIRATAALKPHPLNAEIYGDTADDELVSRVQMLGIIHPLLVTADNVVISGHRRLDAARRLGLAEVPVLVSPVTDPLDVEELLIEANRQRQPSNEQRVREYRHLKSLQLQRAGVRGPRPVLYPRTPAAELVPVPGFGGAGFDGTGFDGAGFDGTGFEREAFGDDAAPISAAGLAPAAPARPLPPLADLSGPAPDEDGIDRKLARQARADAARQVGGSATVLEKGARVVEHIDALEHAELRDEAADLRQLLNRRSVAAAWRKLTVPEVEELEVVDRPPLTRLRKLAEESEAWVARNLESAHADKVQHAVDAMRAVVELFDEEIAE